MFSLCANVLLNLQMDHFPFENVAVPPSKKEEEKDGIGVMVMSSYALTGYKAMKVGFLRRPSRDVNGNHKEDDNDDDERPQSMSLSSLRQWFYQTISEQIEYLSSSAHGDCVDL